MGICNVKIEKEDSPSKKLHHLLLQNPKNMRYILETALKSVNMKTKQYILNDLLSYDSPFDLYVFLIYMNDHITDDQTTKCIELKNITWIHETSDDFQKKYLSDYHRYLAEGKGDISTQLYSYIAYLANDKVLIELCKILMESNHITAFLQTYRKIHTKSHKYHLGKTKYNSTIRTAMLLDMYFDEEYIQYLLIDCFYPEIYEYIARHMDMYKNALHDVLNLNLGNKVYLVRLKNVCQTNNIKPIIDYISQLCLPDETKQYLLTFSAISSEKKQ